MIRLYNSCTGFSQKKKISLLFYDIWKKVLSQSSYHTCNLPRSLFPSIGFAHKVLPFQVTPPPLSLLPSPDVLISSDSYAGQISGLMMDNLPKVGTALRHAASLWMPYGQKQLFSLLSLAQMCQTGCRLQSTVLLALGGGCFRLAWQLITLM